MCTRRFTSGTATSLCEFPNKTTHVLFSDRRELLIAFWCKQTGHWYSLLCVLFTWMNGYLNPDCWTNIAPPALGFGLPPQGTSMLRPIFSSRHNAKQEGVYYWHHIGFRSDLNFLIHDGVHLQCPRSSVHVVTSSPMHKYWRSIRSAILHFKPKLRPV